MHNNIQVNYQLGIKQNKVEMHDYTCHHFGKTNSTFTTGLTQRVTTSQWVWQPL